MEGLGGGQEPGKGQKERKEDVRRVHSGVCQRRELQVGEADRCCQKLLPDMGPPNHLSDFCPSLGALNPVGLPGA